MKREQMKDLARLMSARQASDSARLGRIQAEEADLRAKLASLDNTHRNSQLITAEDALPLRQTGRDIAWQIWAGRRRRDLQIQLARVLARKGKARQELQESFGRRDALEQIEEVRQADTARKTRSNEFEAMLQLAVMAGTERH